MLLLTPVVSFPVAFAPTFTDSSLYLSYRQKRTVSFALRGLRGGFVADAQQHIFAAARREASKPNLVSQKASVSTEFEIPPPAPGNGASVLVIGVAGGSGGGKSVFCKKLKSIVSSICPTVVLSHDSYYKDKPDVDRDCQGNWDCPEALHTAELVKHMIALKRGERVVVPHYDFAANARSPHGGTEQCFLPGTKGVMLVEGLMVLHDEGLRRIMDLRIFVDCDEDTRFMRRLARDTHPLKGRGRTVAEVYTAWSHNVKPNHHRFVEPTKRFAHIIVPHHGLFADPGHLLAVGDPSSLLHAYAALTDCDGGDAEAKAEAGVRAEAEAEAAERELEQGMWPTLYMLQAFVRDFVATPLPSASASH